MIPFISSHIIKMIGISSKLCHHAPPLLRTFDLSNQSFSLLKNNKVTIFIDHHPIILTKSPSFPPHSSPHNPPFGNFPSMASSVARMPSDECLHHHPLCLDEPTHNPHPKTTQSASTNVISLFRENSPDSSNAVSIAVDVSPTMHASSLMQIRKKLESEAWVCPTPSTNVAVVPLVVTEERSSMCNQPTLLAKDITGNAPVNPLLPSPVPLPTPNSDEKTLGVRRSQEMEDFIFKLEEDCRREFIELAKRHQDSQFPFRSHIQSLIRLRFLRQKIATIMHQQLHQQWSQILQEGRFEIESNRFFLRKRLEVGAANEPSVRRERHDINEVPIEENTIVMEVQQLDSHVITFEIPFDHSDSENNRFLELISTRDTESSPQAYLTQAFFMLPSQHKDRQKSQILDSSWDERNLLGSNLDWERPSNSLILRTWHDEVASQGIEISTQEQHVAVGESNWLLQPSNSRRGWGK